MSQDKEIIYEKESEESGEKLSGPQQKIKKLKVKLRKCQKDKKKYLAGWQRSQADFINYKRKWEEKLDQWQKMANEGLIAELLSVLDSFESIDSKAGTPDLAEGLDSIKKQFLDILKKRGLEEIKSVGQVFNPELHEVVETVKASKGQKEGTIVEQVQKGYLFNRKVLRTAKVEIIKQTD